MLNGDAMAAPELADLVTIWHQGSRGHAVDQKAVRKLLTRLDDLVPQLPPIVRRMVTNQRIVYGDAQVRSYAFSLLRRSHASRSTWREGIP